MFSLSSRNRHRSAPHGRPLGRRSGAVVAAVGLVTGSVLSLSPAAAAAAMDPTAATGATAVIANGLPAVTQDVSRLSAFDTELLRLANVARTAAGLRALQEARGLSVLSTWWSGQEAAGVTGGNLEHNPNGMYMVTDYGAAGRTEWAENVMRFSIAGQVSPQSVFDSYYASAGHRANLLNPVYSFVGLGTVTTSTGLSYNTMNFTDVADAGQTYDPRSTITPIGHYESLSLSGATVRMQGWALDPEITTASSVVRIVDTAPDGSVVTRTTPANLARTDVGANYPSAGANHGFDLSYVTASRGAHTACATVVDTGGGLGDVALGCLGYTVGDPSGALTTATLSGSNVNVTGWAVDPDQPTTAATVTITDTKPSGATSTLRTVLANQTSPVSATAVPGSGTAHAFNGTSVVTGSGIHTICATVAANRFAAVIVPLGCQNVTVAGSQKPVGMLGTVTTPTATSVTVTGWAADPGYPTGVSTVTVKITTYRGITETKNLPANGVYPTEVAAGLGRNHAFSATVPLPLDGTSSVCVTAVSRDDASLTTDLGCKSVTANWIDGWQDKVTPATDAKNVRTIDVKGWTIDQAAMTAPVTVKIAVTAPNGTVSTTSVVANALRADVGTAHPGAGNNHGYLSTVKVTAAGNYKVCSTAISTGNASITKSLSCTTVTVK